VNNDEEISRAILMAHGKVNTFIRVNRVKDEIVDNPDKFPILAKETVKTIKGRISRYCNCQNWKQATTKHTCMVFQRPEQKPERRPKK
jgi:hypothetical protein